MGVDQLLQEENDACRKAALQKNLAKAKEQAEKQDAWKNKYEEYIEVIQSKLFVALREGKLKAFGKPFYEDGDGSRTWDDLQHKEIPSDFWRQSKIDWRHSASKNDKGHYHHIYVSTEQLFLIFPEPQPEEACDVHVIAGQYVVDDDSGKKIIKPTRRGRPSMHWDSFHLEMTTRVQNNNLPEKQESLIADMQKWCLQNWGQEPGRSTILQKISPYYQQFKRKKSEKAA